MTFETTISTETSGDPHLSLARVIWAMDNEGRDYGSNEEKEAAFRAVRTEFMKSARQILNRLEKNHGMKVVPISEE